MMAGMTRTVGLLLLALPTFAAAAETFHVSPAGGDAAAGTAAAPFRSPARARDAIRALKAGTGHPPGAVTVVLHGGTYYLPEPLVFTADDSGTAAGPVRYSAAAGETPVLSGGRRLELNWTPYKDEKGGRAGIFRADVPDAKGGKVEFDQLLVDGQPLHLTRYPNFDPKASPFNGTAADAVSPERVKGWARPETAFLHALHANQWGSVHYRVTGVDAKGDAVLQGGHQNNRPSKPHDKSRFVENVFEELDAPGEWFLDRDAGVLYVMPPEGVDLSKAKVEAAGLKHLVEFRGSKDKPVRFVTLQGLTFSGTGRTFMEPYEPLLRSDWCIYRGGAVLAEGAEDCSIADGNFEHLGGNAVFVSRYNRRIAVTGCRFTDVGASAVCFVGDPSAVRNATRWDKPADWPTLDRTPGPKTDDYPSHCLVDDCLMFHLGTVEKQVAGVQISMSARVTVSRCSIYDVPRAGINIGEGTFGGHVIEFCDVFDTVKETGDHGSFNSWGRDRFWGLRGKSLEDAIKEIPDLPKLDMVDANIIRNSRWRCDHGWDIDLDDGSSNYRIYNNLCLRGGIKNREGFWRTVENNIMVDNTFHPHVWYPNSRDIFRQNVVMAAYRPAVMKHWDGELDYNFFPDRKALDEVRDKYHTDPHSLAGDPMFEDPAKGDFWVRNPEAWKVGFKSFPMDQFGVVSPRLKAEARTPQFTNDSNEAAGPAAVVDPKPREWLGGKVRNIAGPGDQSAFGLPGPSGVLILEAPAGSRLARTGLKPDDVVIAAGAGRVRTAVDLIAALNDPRAGGTVELTIVRGQIQVKVAVERRGVGDGG